MMQFPKVSEGVRLARSHAGTKCRTRTHDLIARPRQRVPSAVPALHSRSLRLRASAGHPISQPARLSLAKRESHFCYPEQELLRD